jgi:hypothetical protein
MPSLRRLATLFALAASLGLLAPLLQPHPPKAHATGLPCLGAGIVAGGVGIGDPLGDVCDAVTDPVLGVAGELLDPLKDAAASIGKGVFNQVTAWVAEGAVWLIGEVAELSEKTTSPNLLSKGFLAQYEAMAAIAALMATLMLIFAVFEALGRGDAGMLWRVFLVNVPLAAIATTAAYVVVQLLVATCDGLCDAISQSAGADSKKFFKEAIEALAMTGGIAGGAIGSAGAPGAGTAVGAAGGGVAVPLFVGFIAAIVAAFAAFFVWIELLMRDAAIYVVALFMPLALAASIWPRWVSALRRTCELIVVIVFSKFVIVAIISLAASLLAKNEGAVEHVLAAGAMLLLACFAPFLLFKLVPFAESAVGAAYGRQNAGRSVMRTAEQGTSAQMMRRAAQVNWSGGRSETSSSVSGGGSSGKAARGGAGDAASGGGAFRSAGGSGTAGTVAVPVAAALGAGKSSQSAAERLTETGAAGAAGGTSAGGNSGGRIGTGSPSGASSSPAEDAPRPPQAIAGATPTNGIEEAPTPASTATPATNPPKAPAGASAAGGGGPGMPTPEPREATGGKTGEAAASVPRPKAEGPTTNGKAKS